MLKSLLLDRIFWALADPTRRFMFECLCDGEAAVNQLAEPLPLTLPTILRHLRVLEENGLIHTHKFGRVRTCWVEPQPLVLLDEWLKEQRGCWQRRELSRAG